MTIFTRRQIETVAAALLAAVTAIIGISDRDEEPLGPKFLALEKVGALRRAGPHRPAAGRATSSSWSRSRAG